MRIAVLIIGLMLSVGLFLQSLLADSLGGLANNSDTQTAGGIGIFAALCMIVGSSLVMAFPRIAMTLFAFAGVIAYAGASSSDFSDLWFWGTVCFILAVMSYLGYRGKKRDKVRQAQERADELQRSVLASVSAMQLHAATGQTACPSCGATNATGARFCQACGAPFASPSPGTLPGQSEIA